MTQQLTLPIERPPSYAAADFVPDASNEEALRWLLAPGRWPNRRLVLAGPVGTGKTHLLHITAEAQGWDLLHGPDLRGLPPLPERGVALDEADLPAEEEALLHLMNACAEAGLPLLMAASRAPSRWRLALPDLRSRLAATAVAMLDEPSDALLDALLAKHLADLQFEILDPYIAGVIRRRLPRSAAAMAEAVARLGRASLVAGRRLTRGDALEAIKPLFDDDSGTSGQDSANPVPHSPALL
ncbi:MAG: chromosomal replication initiator DnaA [Rubritepida sp.]|nr:chromosomal replication initiator DnaA [Rubritepida sp.]